MTSFPPLSSARGSSSMFFNGEDAELMPTRTPSGATVAGSGHRWERRWYRRPERGWYLMATIALAVVTAIIVTTAVVLFNSAATWQRPPGGHQPMTGKSYGPEWSIADECHGTFHQNFKQMNEGEECRLVLASAPRQPVTKATAVSLCDATGGQLLYFDSVQEECSAAVAAQELWRRNPQLKEPLNHLWLTTMQYHSDPSGGDFIQWSTGRRTPNYPMRICKGVPLNYNGTAWVMTFAADGSQGQPSYGCWQPADQDTVATPMCKVCKPVKRGALVPLPDVERSRHTDALDVKKSRNFCNGREHLAQLSLLGDKFLERNNSPADTFYDGLQPTCRYYQLTATVYSHQEAVAECSKLDAELLWFDTPREECLVLKHLSPDNMTTSLRSASVWLQELHWAKDTLNGEHVVVWPHGNVAYQPRMCRNHTHEDHLDRKMTLNYYRVRSRGSVESYDCWETRKPQEQLYTVCKRCGLSAQ